MTTDIPVFFEINTQIDFSLHLPRFSLNVIVSMNFYVIEYGLIEVLMSYSEAINIYNFILTSSIIFDNYII